MKTLEVLYIFIQNLMLFVLVWNYTKREVLFTRIIKHKHFKLTQCQKTDISTELPTEWKDGLEPYHQTNDKKTTHYRKKYQAETETLKTVHFGGRLRQCKYFDMGKTFRRL